MSATTERPMKGTPERDSQATTANVAAIGESVASRLRTYDWTDVAAHLDAHGWAMLAGMLRADECRAIAGLYEGGGSFRSHIVMARHGFGRGEYKYCAYPLPGIITDLRTALYPRLAPTANRWNEAMGIDARYRVRSGHRHTTGVIFHDAA